MVLLFCHPAPPYARVSRGVRVEAQRRILAVVGCNEFGAMELEWDELGESDIFPVPEMAKALRGYLQEEDITELEFAETPYDF